MVTRKGLDRVMISCKVTMENGQPVITIEKEPTPRDKVRASLSRFVRDTHKTELLLEHDREVPYGTIVFIEDMAQKAGLSKVTIGLPAGTAAASGGKTSPLLFVCDGVTIRLHECPNGSPQK